MADKIRYYTDEHVSKAVVRGLRERGIEVVTIAEQGMLGASDDEHVKRALVEHYVIFTQDSDFLRLHIAGVEHAGIVYSPQQTPIGDVIRGLMLIYQVLDMDDMARHVEFV